MMRFSLCLLSLVAILPGLAAAQPGGALSVTVDPRSFDTPAPSLNLHPVLHDDVAGLAPGQDLGGTPVPLASRIAAVDLDSYRNSQAYQQAMSHYYPKKPVHTGKQLGGLAGAAVKALVLTAKDKIKERLDDAVLDRIDAGDLPEGTDTAIDAAGKVASTAIALAGTK